MSSRTFAELGGKDLALEQLARATNVPGLVSYDFLKLLPFWDSLRGGPRFAKIVASLSRRNKLNPGLRG